MKAPRLPARGARVVGRPRGSPSTGRHDAGGGIRTLTVRFLRPVRLPGCATPAGALPAAGLPRPGAGSFTRPGGDLGLLRASRFQLEAGLAASLELDDLGRALVLGALGLRDGPDEVQMTVHLVSSLP